jgi:hypothetical protein
VRWQSDGTREGKLDAFRRVKTQICLGGGHLLTERLFLDSEEDGIDKFNVLEVVVDHVVEFDFLKGEQVSECGSMKITNTN